MSYFPPWQRRIDPLLAREDDGDLFQFFRARIERRARGTHTLRLLVVLVVILLLLAMMAQWLNVPIVVIGLMIAITISVVLCWGIIRAVMSLRNRASMFPRHVLEGIALQKTGHQQYLMDLWMSPVRGSDLLLAAYLQHAIAMRRLRRVLVGVVIVTILAMGLAYLVNNPFRPQIISFVIAMAWMLVPCAVATTQAMRHFHVSTTLGMVLLRWKLMRTELGVEEVVMPTLLFLLPIVLVVAMGTVMSGNMLAFEALLRGWVGGARWDSLPINPITIFRYGSFVLLGFLQWVVAWSAMTSAQRCMKALLETADEAWNHYAMHQLSRDEDMEYWEKHREMTEAFA